MNRWGKSNLLKKTFICLLIQVFLVSQMAFALDADDKYQKQKKLQAENQNESSEITLAQATPVTTGYSGLSTQGYIVKSAEQAVDYGDILDNMSDCDLSAQTMILKASGANESEAVTALLGQGNDPAQVKTAMIEAGFDPQTTGAFLDSSISMNNNSVQIQKTQDNSAEDTPAVSSYLGHYTMGERVVDSNGNVKIKTSILWDDSYSFEDRLNCFRTGDVYNQAVQFADLSAEDRQTIFSNLTKGERQALYAALPQNLKSEVAGLLDASDGHVPNISENVTNVYAANPLDGQTTQVALPNLWGNGQLGGGTCQLFFQDGTPVIFSPNNQFNFAPGTTEFQAVSLYYYTSETQSYFFDMGQGNIQVTFYFNGNSEDGITSDNVYATIGGENMWGDNIADGVAIQPLAHEYTHIVVREQTGGESWGENHNWSVAAEIVEEALCTYFPASMTGESKFNEWGRRNEPENIIDIADQYNYNPNENDLNSGVHTRTGVGSGICALSSALWDIRENMGQETADQVIFDAIGNIDFSAGEGAASRAEADSAVFTSFAQALISADEQITGGANRDLIINTIMNHGLNIKM